MVIIFYFSGIFRDFKSLKSQKGGFICAGPARSSRVAALTRGGATRGNVDHVDAYVARGLSWANSMCGPTRIVTQMNTGDSPYIPTNFNLFSLCGTMFFFLFARDMAHQGASNLTHEIMRVDQVDSGPLDHDHTQVTFCNR